MLTIYLSISGLRYCFLVWFYFHNSDGIRLYKGIARRTYKSAIKKYRERDLQYEHEFLRTVCKVTMWCHILIGALLWPIQLFNHIFSLKG